MEPRSHRRSLGWRWLHGSRDPRWGTDIAEFDPPYVRRVVDRLMPVFEHGRYFPTRVRGWEHIPSAPVMMVSNHSGGSSIPDCWGLASAWYRHFGVQRPLHFLAHEILLATRVTGRFLGRVGVLRASRGRAFEVLGKWKRDVIVMPGGDRDVWRPWRDRYRVRFAGHIGYARVALRAGVPIVPIANAGAHDTLMVLTDGTEFARRLRLHQLLRIDVFPVHLSLPWGLGIGPVPHIPIPTQLRYRIGAPVLPPEDWEPGREPPEELVRAYDERVRTAMQSLLDELRVEPRPGELRAD